jgi:hypothetical protein
MHRANPDEGSREGILANTPRYALRTRGASRPPLDRWGAVADSRGQLIMSALIFHRRPIQLHSLDAVRQL